jgi:hypothetical protein
MSALPLPPHLSSTSDAEGGGQEGMGMSDVQLDVISSSSSSSLSSSSSNSRASRADRSGSMDEADHKESEGLMSAESSSAPSDGSGSVSAPASHHARSVPAPRPRSDNQVELLARVPVPGIAPHLRAYYHTLKALSAAGKPINILRLNALVYAVHTVWAISVLVAGWNERCLSENLAVVSLWAARALIGLRVCYWQTHSASAPPTCVDIFFKNWSDCIFLFTGSMFTWNESQKSDCQLNAPNIYNAIKIWTILIYISQNKQTHKGDNGTGEEGPERIERWRER